MFGLETVALTKRQQAVLEVAEFKVFIRSDQRGKAEMV